MRLIRIGEFVDFVSESFFDLNDGVGAEAIAFGDSQGVSRSRADEIIKEVTNEV